MERFTVAASALIEAYGDMAQQGRFTRPGPAAAAFSDMENLLGHLANAGLDRIPYTGADVNELARMEEGFHRHVCTCTFCLGCGEPEGT